MKKYFLLSALGILSTIAFAVFVSAPSEATANPSQFGTTAKTATATTSPTYIIAAQGTSTVVYDSYQLNGTNQDDRGNRWLTDTAAMKIQVNASSTSSVITTRFEYADGTESGTSCITTPASCAWYSGDLFMPLGVSTTTNRITWTFASSTIGGISSAQGLPGINGTNNRNQWLFNVPTPLRYVRAITTVTGANATVWVEIVPIKQASQ